jgi:hypothetical protein
MARLSGWWRRVTGRGQAAQVPAERPRLHAARPAASPALELTDDTPGHRPARAGEAGFDPYASDAGYQKPHAWERLDHD